MDFLFPHDPAEPIMAVIFLIILGVLIWKFVVPSFEKTYAERREAIQGGIEKAERAQAEAAAALEQYNAQLAEARAEASRIREDAKAQGAQIVAEMREKATAESERILESSRSQLAAERNQVRNELRDDVGGLATTLAGRILGESLDDSEKVRGTVDRFLADLEAKNGAAVEVERA